MALEDPLLTPSSNNDEKTPKTEMQKMSADIQKHLGLKFTLGELIKCSDFSSDGKYLVFITDTNLLHVINVEDRFNRAEMDRNQELGRISTNISANLVNNQPIPIKQFERNIDVIKIKQIRTDTYIIGCSGTNCITLFELREGNLVRMHEARCIVTYPALEITDNMKIIHNSDTKIQIISFKQVKDEYEFTPEEEEENAYSVISSTVISSSGEKIVSGNSNGEIHRLWPKQEMPIVVDTGNRSSISAICYYKTFIIAGNADGIVYMYNDYQDSIRFIKKIDDAHAGMVKFVIGSPFPFRHYFLTAGRDATIKLWKMHKDSSKGTYLHNSFSKGDEKHFKAINFNLNSEIQIATRSGKVLRYLSPEYLDSETCLAQHSEEIYHLCSYESNLISFSKDQEIKILENIEEQPENYSFIPTCTSSREKGTIVTEVLEKPMAISNNGNTLIYYAGGRFIKYDIQTARIIENIQEDPVISIISYEDNKNYYIFTGHKGHWIRQWSINDLKSPLSETKVHTSRVRSLALAEFESGTIRILFSGGKYNLIGYKIDQIDIQTKVKAHSKCINDLKVSKDFLISCSDDCLIIIWNINFAYNELSLAKLKQISYHSQRVTSLLISDNYFMASSFDGKVSIWNLSDFSLCLSLNFDGKCSSVVPLKDDSILAVAVGKKIIVLDNPINTQKFLIFGNQSKIRAFIKYINSALTSSPPEHDVEMDNFFIAKYHINILHIYADRDLAEHLTLSLKANGPFSATFDNETPLSLSLKKEHRDCINAILDNINKKIIESPKTASYLEENLDLLNEIGTSSLDEFYKAIFIKRENEIEKFVTKFNKLPKIIYSETFVPLKRNFEEDNFIFGHQGPPIIFFISAVKANMTCGSWESIRFLTSLKNCPNESIFMTKYIRTLLLDKWNTLRLMIWTQTFIYFSYLILLTLYFILFNDTWGFLYLLSFFNFILFLIEVAHMKVNFKSYIKDKWNYFDILRDISMFFYVFFKEILEISYDNLGLLLIIVVVLSWAKGISYFRVHKSTRYIVNLFSNVIKDMISFVIFLFFLDLAFVVIFIAIDHYEQNEIQSIDSYFTSIYLLNYGDFSTEEYTTVKWVLCFFATLCNTLIMLNLCIAIIGNSFNKVQENRVIADQLEMIDIILECELLMVTRRNKGGKSYLQMCMAKENKEKNKDKCEEILNEIQGNMQRSFVELNEKTNKAGEDIEKLKEMIQVLIDR